MSTKNPNTNKSRRVRDLTSEEIDRGVRLISLMKQAAEVAGELLQGERSVFDVVDLQVVKGILDRYSSDFDLNGPMEVSDAFRIGRGDVVACWFDLRRRGEPVPGELDQRFRDHVEGMWD